MPKIRMRAELGFYSNDPEGRCELRLTDDSTGVMAIRTIMDARQFRDFIASGGIKLDVNMPAPSYMRLLGADMQVDVVQIPRKVYADERSRGSEAPASVTKWARALEDERQRAVEQDDRKTVHVESRNTNHGWEAIVRTYTLRTDED